MIKEESLTIALRVTQAFEDYIRSLPRSLVYSPIDTHSLEGAMTVESAEFMRSHRDVRVGCIEETSALIADMAYESTDPWYVA